VCYALLCFALFLGGCGSTAAIVKENLDKDRIVPNAFTRALCFLENDKKSPPPKKQQPALGKLTSYPPMPADENGPRVRRFVREYAYAQRKNMKEYLNRAEQYFPVVKKIAAESGLPQEIAYLAVLESGGNPEARSPANALGMWQFMPDTARNYGLRVDSVVDERLDPWKSTQAAMMYLKDLYGMFGCWRLALSAYNSGENKLNKVLCQEDASEYDEICSSRRLKRETREFFPRFQAIAIIAKNPTKYGFATLKDNEAEERHELVPVEGCYSLETLAKTAGVSGTQLAALNPALIRGVTPESGPPYSLRVPAGVKQVLASKLNDLPSEQSNQNIVHVVNKGDNASRIAQRYRVSKTQLARVNPDVNLRRGLKRGAKIVVPLPTKAPAKKPTKQGRLSLLH